MASYYRGTAAPDTVETWSQEVEVSIAEFVITPTSGSLQISYDSALGVTSYWNGSAFIAGPPITLATTIDVPNKKSKHVGLTVPDSLLNLVLRFRGWVNGDTSTTHIVDLEVTAGGSGGGGGGSLDADVRFLSPTEPEP